MSKQVKDLITRDLSGRLKDLDGVAVINPRGIDGNKNHGIRRRLRAKGLRMTVVKNTLAKRAVADGAKIKGFEALLDGPSAVIYGKASISAIARILIDEKKNTEALELRGVFFDGEAYPGEEGVKRVSTLPTREEAIGQLVSLILAPGGNLVAALKGPGGKLGGVLKAIEEKGGGSDGGEAVAAPSAEGSL
jgi:large subunit ribosomal protein L10